MLAHAICHTPAPPAPLQAAVLHPYIPQLVLIVGVAMTQVQTLHLDLLNFTRITWAHCLGLSGWHPVPQVSAAPHSLVSSSNLLRVCLIPMSVMMTYDLAYILKRYKQVFEHSEMSSLWPSLKCSSQTHITMNEKHTT